MAEGTGLDGWRNVEGREAAAGKIVWAGDRRLGSGGRSSRPRGG